MPCPGPLLPHVEVAGSFKGHLEALASEYDCILRDRSQLQTENAHLWQQLKKMHAVGRPSQADHLADQPEVDKLTLDANWIEPWPNPDDEVGRMSQASLPLDLTDMERSSLDRSKGGSSRKKATSIRSAGSVLEVHRASANKAASSRTSRSQSIDHAQSMSHAQSVCHAPSMFGGPEEYWKEMRRAASDKGGRHAHYKSKVEEDKLGQLYGSTSSSAFVLRSISSLSERVKDRSIRNSIKAYVNSRSFEIMMGLIVLFNLVVIIVETDANVGCDSAGCSESWVVISNHVLLVIYTIELIVRLYAYRWDFFYSAANVLDFFIVISGYTDILATVILSAIEIPGLQLLRIFRIARLTRAARILALFPELAIMVKGFASAIMAMMWGFCMLMVLLLILSILIVELIYPISSNIDDQTEACTEFYASVWMSIIYSFRTMMASDGWGSCAVPVMKEVPVTFAFFSITLVGIELGYTNLIMSVILQRAAKTHDEDIEERNRDKQQQRARARQKLLKICEAVDYGNTGQITVDGLISGCKHVPELRVLFEMLGLDVSDLPRLLELLDTEGNGFLTYREFVDVFEHVEAMDLKMQLMLDHFCLVDLGRQVKLGFELIQNGGLANDSERSDMRDDVNEGDLEPAGPAMTKARSSYSVYFD